MDILLKTNLICALNEAIDNTELLLDKYKSEKKRRPFLDDIKLFFKLISILEEERTDAN